MKILVIEDNSAHMDEAVAAVEAAGHTAVSSYDMRGLDEAVPSWDKPSNVDAVISDVYFPLNRGYEGCDEDVQNYSKPQPIGVAVALRCEAKEVPFVLCTDGYHHGNALEWIFELCQERGWTMIDAYPEEKPYTSAVAHKNWQKAIEAIEAKVAAK